MSATRNRIVGYGIVVWAANRSVGLLVDHDRRGAGWKGQYAHAMTEEPANLDTQRFPFCVTL